MMELTIDMSEKDVRVTRVAQPKVDQNSEQRSDKETGLPLWSVQVCVTDHTGGEVISVVVAGEKPDLVIDGLVEVDRLVAAPWLSNGRQAISYRAVAVRPLVGEDDWTR